MSAAFAHALLRPRAIPPGLTTWNGSDVAHRFAIYRNNVAVSLIDALAHAFPSVAALVGETFFRALARGFVRAHPPRTPVLAHYGAAFAGYVARCPSVAALPYLSDIARLDRAVHAALHAADAHVWSAADLARAAPDALLASGLALHPSLRLRASSHAVATIWSALRGDGDLACVDPARPERVLIVRPDAAVRICALSPGADALLRALARRERLDTALAAANAAEPAFTPADAVALLVGRGLITGRIERSR